MLRWKSLLALVVSGLIGLVLAAPVRAETVSCQSFADSYAARLAGSQTLSPLFEIPFSFAEMDWLEVNGAAAVGVLKQADLAVGDGMAGELVCTPEGAIKQVEICADLRPGENQDAVAGGFAPLVDAFLEIGGAGATRRQAVAETIAGTGVQDADGAFPEATRDFISLDAPLYAFALSQSGFFCLDILQSLDQ